MFTKTEWEEVLQWTDVKSVSVIVNMNCYFTVTDKILSKTETVEVWRDTSHTA